MKFHPPSTEHSLLSISRWRGLWIGLGISLLISHLPLAAAPTNPTKVDSLPKTNKSTGRSPDSNKADGKTGEPKSPELRAGEPPARQETPTRPSPSNFPAPGGLWAQPLGSTVVQLKWEAVPGATGYEVYVWRNGRWSFNEDDPNLTPIAAGTTLTGLQPGQPYEFAIKAVGPGGITSVMSRAVGARTPQPDAPVEAVNPPPSTGNTTAAKNANSSSTSLAPTRSQTSSSQRRLPPPETPSGLFGYFQGTDIIKLQWRKTPETLRYAIEEEINGQWLSVERTKGDPTQTFMLLLERPMPGPYRFRVKSVNKEGTSSEPSLPISISQ